MNIAPKKDLVRRGYKPIGFCYCCGGRTKLSKSFFLPGHDQKFRSRNNLPTEAAKPQNRPTTEFRKPPTHTAIFSKVVDIDLDSVEKNRKYLSKYHYLWYNISTIEKETVILKRAMFQVTPQGEVIPGENFNWDDPDMAKAARDMAKAKKGTYRSKKEQDIVSDDAFDALIPDEEAAIAFLEKLTWGDTPFCPNCGSENVYRPKSGKPMSHRCRDCRRYFSARSKTPMEGSQISTRNWLRAIRKAHTAKLGLAATKLYRETDLTYKTCWFMMHRIREMMDVGHKVLSGIVEIDETQTGGKEKNKHAKDKLHENWRAGKVPVWGMRDHVTGEVVFFPIRDTNRKTLEDLIRKHVAPGSRIYTDGHQGYSGIEGMGRNYTHEFVVHDVGEYVRGQATTNGIESNWAKLDRAYMGVYCYISPKHLARYCNESAHRLNSGPGNGPDTMAKTIKNGRGKRLKWYDLIADPEEATCEE